MESLKPQGGFSIVYVLRSILRVRRVGGGNVPADKISGCSPYRQQLELLLLNSKTGPSFSDTKSRAAYLTIIRIPSLDRTIFRID